MTRPLRTLLLSAAALGALATAAAATPSAPPPFDAGMAGMAAMHAAGPTHMDHDTAGMTAMHTAMSADPGVHVDAMQSDCPMLTEGSMGMMHRDGGHHEPSAGDRS